MNAGYDTLASVLSVAEGTFINGLRPTISSYWSGLNDQSQEGSWVWTSNENFTYLDWSNGEPNSFDGDEDCVAIHGTFNQWADFPCEMDMAFVCEHR